MRRGARVALCLLLFLWCNCTRIIRSHSTADAVQARNVASDSSGETSESEGESGKNSFPYDKFETMFYKLAEEMGLHTEGDEAELHTALEKLFTGIPETVSQRGKAVPQIHQGLLKKMLAAKMERQSAGQQFDFAAFMKEFSSAMKHLQDFSPEKGASPADALQQLAQLTKTWVSPEGMVGMQKYMEQAARVLKDFLPALSADDEL